MHLQKYLEEKADGVNAALDALLPPASHHPRRLHEAMRYSLFAGGKRIRPILVLASSQAVGGRERDAMNTACAFECIHTYSLIHDDLPSMDDDDLRRGEPTCHKKYDEATAILAGDALLTLAFQLICSPGADGADSDALLRVACEAAHGAGAAGMVGGQVIDICSEGAELTLPSLESMHIRKTGALIRGAIRSGGDTRGRLRREP